MVGTARFELTTSRTPSERATRLRYVPKYRVFRVVLSPRIVNFIDFHNLTQGRQGATTQGGKNSFFKEHLMFFLRLSIIAALR